MEKTGQLQKPVLNYAVEYLLPCMAVRKKTCTGDPSCLRLCCCMHYCYTRGAWSGRQEQRKGAGRAFLCYKPGSGESLSWLLQGGEKKRHVAGHKNLIAGPQSPKACVTGSKGCSFKPLPKHTEAVKQTETQEWRNRLKTRQGCCSVVKQCP